MKNVFLLIAAFTGLLAATSCQKDKEANTPNTTNAINRSANTAKMKPTIIFGPDRYRVWVVNTTSCVYTGGNCLDDVIIRSKSVSSLMSLVVGSGDYVGFIKSNMEDLSADIPGDYLQNVADEILTLSVKSNEDTKMDYLIFKNSKEETVLVIPFNR